MLNKYILEPIISEMLTVLQEVFSKFEIDFYLVGAVARDINLSANEELASTRRTILIYKLFPARSAFAIG